ncbi:MAG: hypothetical protein NTY17_02965 [Planctomycetia bacterium]|nr:hypothetical protein [Planctomycetia bacterium]
MPSPAPLQSSPSQSTSAIAATANWFVTGHRMTDAGSVIPAAVDLDQPRQGITLAGVGVASASTLLGLDLRSDCRLTDHWVRGDDVTRHLRTTAMWRLHPSEGATRAWELIASTQTSQLQSDAVLAVVSEIDATDILWGTWANDAVRWHADQSPEATCVLLGRGGAAGSGDTSVLVAAHPGDARRMTARRDGTRVVVECWLFSTELEKGVLLRSRVLAAVGPAADATRWAGDLAATFAASPPMLTT